MERPRWVVGEIVGLYWDSKIADDVPALAWFLLASLAPLALGVTALASVLLGDYNEAQALAERVAKVLPADVHAQVAELILRTKHDSPALIAGAILAMLWVSSGAVGVLARCMTRLLEIPEHSPVVGKLRNLGVAGAIATVVVLMVIVASAASGLSRRSGLDPRVIRIAVPVLSTGITALLLAGVYWWLSLGRVQKRAALAGGVLGAVILQATPTAAGYYLRYVAGETPGELFLMLAGVLFTCYLAALGLLLGGGTVARVQLGRRLGTRVDAPVSAHGRRFRP